MAKYTIDIHGKARFKYMLRLLRKRKNTCILFSSEYFFPDPTGYYQIVIDTDNIGKLAENKHVYGIVDQSGNLL
jgi:hypothetical protein